MEFTAHTFLKKNQYKMLFLFRTIIDMKKIILSLFAISISIIANAQETFPVNGTSNNNHTTYAFTNAKIYVDADEIIEHLSIIFRN